MLLISIDHGNKNIKTEHATFVSGLIHTNFDRKLGSDTLLYNGQYYKRVNNHLPYMRDKTATIDFYILTLYAIAYEIEANDAYSAEDYVEINLLIDLPISHYGTLSEKWEQYFTRDDGFIDFVLDEKPYKVFVNAVYSYPQGVAAIMVHYNEIREYAKTTVIDIGGYTTDYFELNHGRLNEEVFDSLDNGIIIFYNEVIKNVQAQYDITLAEDEIDAVLSGENNELCQEIQDYIIKEAERFTRNLINKLRELRINLKSGKTYFIGGGAMRLQRQIESCGDLISSMTVVDDVKANAMGNLFMYKNSDE